MWVDFRTGLLNRMGDLGLDVLLCHRAVVKADEAQSRCQGQGDEGQIKVVELHGVWDNYYRFTENGTRKGIRMDPVSEPPNGTAPSAQSSPAMDERLISWLKERRWQLLGPLIGLVGVSFA